MASISKPSSSASTVGEAERTLIARFHSLGDVVLSTGIACSLAGRGVRVEVATARRFRPLFEGLPLAAVWDPQDLKEAGRFDRVVDLQANASSRRLLDGLGPARRHDSRPAARRWLVFWGDRSPAPRIPHVVLRYAEAAGCPGSSPTELRPRIAVTERDIDAARKAPHAWETTGEGCVALAEGASRRMKRWPAERFERLAEALRGEGVRALRILDPAGAGGPSPGELDGDGDGDHVRELDGAVQAPLRPLKGLLARCRAVVTNDSGVMHLAVGLGLPVVALFGSTVTKLGFGPVGERDRVIQKDLACRPCAVHGARFCWQGHQRCLAAITPQEVLEAVLGILREEESR